MRGIGISGRPSSSIASCPTASRAAYITCASHRRSSADLKAARSITRTTRRRAVWAISASDRPTTSMERPLSSTKPATLVNCGRSIPSEQHGVESPAPERLPDAALRRCVGASIVPIRRFPSAFRLSVLVIPVGASLSPAATQTLAHASTQRVAQTLLSIVHICTLCARMERARCALALDALRRC